MTVTFNIVEYIFVYILCIKDLQQLNFAPVNDPIEGLGLIQQN